MLTYTIYGIKGIKERVKNECGSLLVLNINHSTKYFPFLKFKLENLSILSIYKSNIIFEITCSWNQKILNYK